MGKLEVSYRVQARDAFGRFLAVYNAAMARAVAQAAEKVEELAVAFAPRDTGELAASIEAIPQGKTATVRATAEHAPYQEFGAGPHDIPNAFGRGITVLHPGNPATHFMQRASEAAQPFFVNYVIQNFPA